MNLIVIIDNTEFSDNRNDIMSISCDKVKIITNMRNMGIAIALNQGFSYLHKNGYEWAISFDQDSICPSNICDEFKKYSHMDKVAIFCPRIYDINYNGYLDNNQAEEYIYIEKCITSGSITNLEIWDKVGKFDEKMFIDYVDFDFCATINKFGYKIVKLNNIVLKHEIGNASVYSIFGKKIRVSNHSQIRKYYMGRNIVYYIRKHKLHIILEILRLFKILFFILFFEKDKTKKIKSFFMGIYDGMKMQISIV